MSKPDERRKYTFCGDRIKDGTMVYHVTGGDTPASGVFVALPEWVPASSIYSWLEARVDSWLRGQHGSAA